MFVLFAEVFGLAFFALLLTQINNVSDVMGETSKQEKDIKDGVLQFLKNQGLDKELIPLVQCGSAWTRCASLCRSRASHGASHRRRGGSVRPLQAPAAHLGAGVRAHGGRLRVWRVGVVPCTVGTRGSLGCQSMAMPLLTRIVGPHSAVQLHVVRLDLRRSGRGPRRASTRVRRRAFG